MPPLVIVKVPPCRSSTEILPSRALVGEAGDGLFDRGEGELIGVAEDGHHQAAVGADGDADVVDNCDRRSRRRRCGALTAGNAFRASTTALTKNDMKPRPTPCLFLEGLLVAGAQLDDARHVGLVEGGEDRGGLLDFDQALGDALAKPAHALAGFAPSGPAVRARHRPCGRGLAERPPVWTVAAGSEDSGGGGSR